MQPIRAAPVGALTAVIFVYACWSCSSNNASIKTQVGSTATGTGTHGDTTYLGSHSLAYTIGGRQVAIKEFMHKGDGNNWMALFINDVINKNGLLFINVTNELTKEVLKFSVVNTGACVVTGTFTGKFLSAYHQPVPLEIAGGSFDVPFTKHKDN